MAYIKVKDRRRFERKEFRDYIKLSDDKVLDTKKNNIDLLGDDEIFVGTESGKIIRLAASSIATSGRASIGSKAITLENGDFAFTASLAPQSIEKEGVQE